VEGHHQLSASWWASTLGVIPVAAVVSAIVTLAIRWLDKPRPVFVFEMQLTDAKFIDKDAELTVATIAVTNVGDGPAYDVEIVGDRCDAAVDIGKLAPEHSGRWATRLPKIASGETVLVRTGTLEQDKVKAKLVVRWDPSPGRPLPSIRRRMREVALDDVNSAMPFPVGMLEPAALPRWFRRWRKLSLHAERGRMQSPEWQRREGNADADRMPDDD
jgi:hypothetical protein